MGTTIEKQWMALDGDEEIVAVADTREALMGLIDTEPCPDCGHRTTEYDIVAVPKPLSRCSLE